MIFVRFYAPLVALVLVAYLHSVVFTKWKFRRRHRRTLLGKEAARE